jgi:regulatory protein
MKPRRANTKPTADERTLYEAAVRALARRARSVNEVRRLLERRKAAKQDVEAVLKRLRDNGYLDDARFARSFAAFRIESEGFGSRRVRRDLAARRVHPELIEKAVAGAYEDVDERKLLRDYLRRKLRLTKPPEKPSAVASLYRRLLRAGFASDTIVKELHGLLRSSPLRSRAKVDPEQWPAQWEAWLESLADTPEPEAEE